MATNELEEPTGPTGLAAAQLWLTGAVAEVTDTGPGRLPLRVWILLVVVNLCCLLAPLPASAVGVVSTLLLAMSLAVRRRP